MAYYGIKMIDLLRKINSLQIFCGGCFLVCMVFLTCGNILFRQFGMPIRGTFEIMGFLGAMLFALSLGYSHDKKEHLYVSILFDRFPEKLRRVLQKINAMICGLFFSLLTWQLIKKALNMKSVGEVSETLQMIYYPFILVLAFGTFVLVLFILYELFKKGGNSN